MTLSPSPSHCTHGDRHWMLWVDGCGGFLVVTDSEVRVGREASAGQVDVALIADVPRLAGKIVRDQAEYYWQDSNGRKWIEPGMQIDGLGSAKLRLGKPSELCNSAVLNLDPPHRFGGHVDAVLLVDQTWLIGPSDDCHIRCRSLSSPWVVSRGTEKGSEKWWIKRGFGGAPAELSVSRQFTMGETASTEVTMLLEPLGPTAVH